jgi:hypothetical protein
LSPGGVPAAPVGQIEPRVYAGADDRFHRSPVANLTSALAATQEWPDDAVKAP